MARRDATQDLWGVIPVFDIDIHSAQSDGQAKLRRMGHWLGADLDAIVDTSEEHFRGSLRERLSASMDLQWSELSGSVRHDFVSSQLKALREAQDDEVEKCTEALATLCYIAFGCVKEQHDTRALSDCVAANIALLAQAGALPVVTTYIMKHDLTIDAASLARTLLFCLVDRASAVSNELTANLFRLCLLWMESQESATVLEDSRLSVDAVLLLDSILESHCGPQSSRRSIKARARLAAGCSKRPREQSVVSARALKNAHDELLAKFPSLGPAVAQTCGPETDSPDAHDGQSEDLWVNVKAASMPGGVSTPAPSPLLRARRTLFQTDPAAMFELPLYAFDTVVPPTSILEGVALLADSAPETVLELQIASERHKHRPGKCGKDSLDRLARYHEARSGAFDFVDSCYGVLLESADDVLAVMFSFAERTLDNLGAMSEHLGVHNTEVAAPGTETDNEVRTWLFDEVDASRDAQMVLLEQTRLHAVVRGWLNLLRACRVSNALKFECIAAKIWDRDYAKLLSQSLLVLNQLHFPSKSLSLPGGLQNKMTQQGAHAPLERPRPQRTMTDSRSSGRSSMDRSTVVAMHDCIRLADKLVRDYPARAASLNSARGWLSMKRCLRVPDRPLQDATLKLYKRMIPYTPRKWRQANMKIITQIYLRCPPRLRDDWMSVVETEGEAASSFLAREMAMRALVQQYNRRHYPSNVHNLGFDALPRSEDLAGCKPTEPSDHAHAKDDIDDIDEQDDDEVMRGLELDVSLLDHLDVRDDFFAQELAKDSFEL